MKKYTHAWLALKAVQFLTDRKAEFHPVRQDRIQRFLDFICEFPSTFVRGAWFPDTVISDNTQGGHTWKYFGHAQGNVVTYRPPTHHCCLQFVEQDLDLPVKLAVGISDLPDRCEALSQTIRDTIIITNKTKAGDVVAFNNSQIALFFPMLSHYVADACVPAHADKRDFYKPSKVHPDLEAYWESPVKKYHSVSTAAQQFDLDEHGHLQVKTGKPGWSAGILKKCDDVLAATNWQKMATSNDHWSALLGSTNNNVWDLMVGVCRVSYQMSLLMFPLNPGAGVDYDMVRIREVPPFKERLALYSPYILADSIMSVALVWLATWERWELLKKGVK